MKKLTKCNPSMAIIWSIAFPGFGQIYNRQFLKAILFILMEFIVNLNGHLNQSIIHSFFWEISLSQSVLNYEWIMFYPCIYVIPIWDAYATSYIKSFEQSPPSINAIPFALGSMFATVGLIYGSRLIPGPIFMPIILIIVGAILGIFIKKWIEKRTERIEI